MTNRSLLSQVHLLLNETTLCGPMEPIVPVTQKHKIDDASARGTLADRVACGLAALAACVALAYSGLFFSRFLENDAHLWGVVSAFLLCFGVGAFAYIPAGITSLIAWKAYKNGATQRGLAFTLILLFPWIALSLALTFISDMPKLYSLPILITVLLLTAWALISLRNFNK